MILFKHCLCWQFIHLIFLVRYCSLLNQLVTVLCQNGRHAAYLLIHEWLREHRLVNLVVPVTTVANLMHMHTFNHKTSLSGY